jgi:hypothetical protein
MKIGSAQRVSWIRGSRTMSPRSSHCVLKRLVVGLGLKQNVAVLVARKHILKNSSCGRLKKAMLCTSSKIKMAEGYEQRMN